MIPGGVHSCKGWRYNSVCTPLVDLAASSISFYPTEQKGRCWKLFSVSVRIGDPPTLSKCKWIPKGERNKREGVESSDKFGTGGGRSHKSRRNHFFFFQQRRNCAKFKVFFFLHHTKDSAPHKVHGLETFSGGLESLEKDGSSKQLCSSLLSGK